MNRDALDIDIGCAIVGPDPARIVIDLAERGVDPAVRLVDIQQVQELNIICAQWLVAVFFPREKQVECGILVALGQRLGVLVADVELVERKLPERRSR